jgi:hypothetical protein
VRYLVLAGSVRDRAAVDRVGAALEMPVRVVRLTVPLPEIERRLRANVTTARSRDDLPRAAAWVADSTGVGLEDLPVLNDRPIREVAMEILDWLGWE